MEGRHELSITKHFVKVMMPGFHQKMNLPPIVSKEVEARKSRRVILESRIGKWSVSLCKNHENGLICLKQGWPEFVERHALTIGEFVFFKLTDDLHFNVSVFGTNMSEKEFRNEEKEEEEEEEEGTEALNPMEEATQKGVTCFAKRMKPLYARNKTKVNIPVKFLRANNLGGPQQSRVILNDPNGRSWAVSLLKEMSDGIRFRMKTAFYASNRLKDGDSCVFHLNRRLLTPTTIVLDVNIIRNRGAK